MFIYTFVNLLLFFYHHIRIALSKDQTEGRFVSTPNSQIPSRPETPYYKHSCKGTSKYEKLSNPINLPSTHCYRQASRSSLSQRFQSMNLKILSVLKQEGEKRVLKR